MTNLLWSTIGGVIIGAAAAGMYWANGRIMGVSGIVGGSLNSRALNLYWRIAFLIGLFAGALLIEPLGFTIMTLPIERSLVAIAGGGLLVGFGTTVGNGCTSGHGVCGIGRLSPRSLVATSVFIGSGMITVFVINWLF